MVLAGGPDRERSVSLASGDAVAGALVAAGHEVLQRDVGPGDLSALDEWRRWGGGVVFPVLHGPWGEGGPLQRVLEAGGVRYVGSCAEVAAVCIDKQTTKQVLQRQGLATPAYELVADGGEATLGPPCVVKAVCEGSSFDVVICRDDRQRRDALARLGRRYPRLMVERFVGGHELTVGVIGPPGDERALPVIRIIPPEEGFYDYRAKYQSEQTRYLLGPDRIGLSAEVLAWVSEMGLRAHRVLGCRHMSRVDVIVDQQGRPWVLEVNTVPGFTSHSLLPKAAAHAGIDLPGLVDRLVKLAMTDMGTPTGVDQG